MQHYENQPEQLSNKVQVNQEGLTDMQPQDLNALLTQYSDVFSKSHTD